MVLPISIRLTLAQRRALERTLAQPTSRAGHVRRIRVVLLSDDGLCDAEIASRLDRSQEQVSRIRRKRSASHRPSAAHCHVAQFAA